MVHRSFHFLFFLLPFVFLRFYTLKPKPAMQVRYWSIVDLQSAAGSLAFEKSMHSSRLDFSCVQTQQGFEGVS